VETAPYGPTRFVLHGVTAYVDTVEIPVYGAINFACGIPHRYNFDHVPLVPRYGGTRYEIRIEVGGRAGI
jgi:hypothetical protein